MPSSPVYPNTSHNIQHIYSLNKYLLNKWMNEGNENLLDLFSCLYSISAFLREARRDKSLIFCIFWKANIILGIT